MDPRHTSIPDLGGIPPIIDAEILGSLLKKTPGTIYVYRNTAPHRLPPACTPPGTRTPLWLLADVLEWLAEFRAAPAPAPNPLKKEVAEEVRPATSKPRRGASTMAERTEAKRLGLSVRELRAQRALELGEGGGS